MLGVGIVGRVVVAGGRAVWVEVGGVTVATAVAWCTGFVAMPGTPAPELMVSIFTFEAVECLAAAKDAGVADRAVLVPLLLLVAMPTANAAPNASSATSTASRINRRGCSQ